MMSAVIIFLRETFGILLVAYIDDLLIQAANEQMCKFHAELVLLVLQDLGYGINFKKSAFKLAQIVEHLGFTWHSDSMTVSLTQAKCDDILAWTERLLAKGSACCWARSRASG